MGDLQVHPDPLRSLARDVLERVGDAALPARPFHELVDMPVGPAAVDAMSHRRRLLTAVAAVAVLVLGVVGLRAVGGRDASAGSGVAVMSERSVAVPLYVPEGMALNEAGVAASGGVLGVDGTAVDRAAASWNRSDASLTVSSASGDQPLAVTGESEVELRTGVVARYTEYGDGLIDLAWRQADGGPVVGIRTIGLDLDEIVAIANSMWFVTPAIWADLTDRAGFAAPEEAQAGYDGWTPPSDVDLDDESAVRVVGDLQNGLDLRYPDGNGTFFSPLTADAEWCTASSQADSTDPERWPIVLVTFDPTVTGFMVPDAEGEQRRIDASRHPGLPQMRFAVSETSTLSYGMPNVPCVRGDG